MARVSITRTDLGEYLATNEAGSELAFGEGADQFSAVELLLAALGGCTGIDVDYLTARRSEPQDFEITVSADKVSDPRIGNHLENVVVAFRVTFPSGPEGDAAREVLPVAARHSHDRLCTVGRTLQLPTSVALRIQ
jgi:putative redox protein